MTRQLASRRVRLVYVCSMFVLFVCACALLLADTRKSVTTQDISSEMLDIRQPAMLHSMASRRLLSVSSPASSPAAVLASANCTRPAVEQFPRSVFSQRQRRAGAVLFYVVGALYCFLALAAICDDYFVPALEEMAHMMGLSEDVAGATLLAAGSSAPELATTILAVFVTKDDIGVSGVIGSAVFNALLVISVSALMVSDAISLRPYPMLRDCTCYLLSIGLLLAAIADANITWYESVCLVIGYAVYCVVMWRNSALETWLMAKFGAYNNMDKRVVVSGAQASRVETEEDASLEGHPTEISGMVRPTPFQEVNVFEVPDTFSSRVLFFVSLPLIVLHYLSVPDVRCRRWRQCYLLTFFMSITWIGVYSYLMVWMITVIGFTLQIPDTVMGLSFIAIGVSMPDVLASVAVARDGYGDMAVSNALGSNVFDILFCMGVPWLIQTTLVQPGSTVKVDSKGVVYSTLLLLATVVFLLGSTHWHGWTLSRTYGISLLLWYCGFLVVACLVELNVFGQMNLPMCPSNF